MKYKVLSAVDTDVWLNNINCTLKVLRDVISLYENEVQAKKELAIILYHETPLKKLWAQLWYGLYSTEDVIIGSYSGNVSSFNGITWWCTLSKIPPVSRAVMDCRDLADKFIANGDVDLVMNLNQAWSQYASQPFEYTEEDLFKYFKVLNIHKECKLLLQALGIYDEALNVVEDSISSSR